MTDKVGFKDLGAGGVACASIELADAAGMGAEVWADKIHTSMDGLQSHVILCSETQERFMWACHPDTTPIILEHYNKKFDLPNVSSLAQAKVVGKIIKDRHYTVYANNKKIIDGPIAQINEGFVYKRPLKEVEVIKTSHPLPSIKNHNDIILELLAMKIFLLGRLFMNAMINKFKVELFLSGAQLRRALFLPLIVILFQKKLEVVVLLLPLRTTQRLEKLIHI